MHKLDKHEALGNLLDEYDYEFDDLAKLLCRIMYRLSDTANMKQVYYGDGKKFTLTIRME